MCPWNPIIYKAVLRPPSNSSGASKSCLVGLNWEIGGNLRTTLAMVGCGDRNGVVWWYGWGAGEAWRQQIADSATQAIGRSAGGAVSNRELGSVAGRLC